MAEETVTIIRVDTGEAVKNIADLKANIATYKRELESLDIGSKEYADTLVKLQENQAALKNAMHDTTYEAGGSKDSFEATAKAAKGLGTSYNALVRRMADLDQQFRATEDAARRADLGGQIKAINEQLKELDEQRGKFGRNVGNYFGDVSAAIKGVVKDLPSGLSVIKRGLDDTTKSLALLGKQPIIGIAGLIAPLVVRIAEGLKENETALEAVRKVGKALEPVAQFFQGALEKIAGLISRAVDYVLELGDKSGVSFKNIVTGAVGVGNAVLQFLLTPVRTVIDAFKGLGNIVKDVITGNFSKIRQDATEAARGIGDAFRKGFSFKANFEAGKAVGEQFASGLSSTRRDAQQAAQAVGSVVREELRNTLADVDKALREGDAKLEAHRRRMEQEARETADILAGIGEDYSAELDAQLQSMLDAERAAAEEERRIQQQRVDAFFAFGSAVAAVASSVAAVYEADAEQSERAAAKSKALKTAAAVIDTISGAIGAYMGTMTTPELPITARMVLAPINAAAVLAAGYAQIRQINSVRTGSSAGAGSVPAAVSPPLIPDSGMQQVRTVTGASEEERLNRMADPQRVYILSSDLEADRDARRVRVRQTSW